MKGVSMPSDDRQESPPQTKQKSLSETIQEVFRTYEANIREVEKTYVRSSKDLNVTLR
jgi:predicted component of type VI protein secretion system